MKTPRSGYGAEFTISDGVLARIKIKRDSLFPAEARVADVILSSPEAVVYMPISELALAARVSQGTVVRLCQSIEVGGYQALKLGLAADISQPAKAILQDVGLEDAADPVGVARKVFRADINALEDTLRVVQGPRLDSAVDAMTSAQRIVFFASGGSLVSALDAYGRFLRIGLPVRLDLDSHSQVLQAALLGKGDVGFGISHSGRSREPVECLSIARQLGARTIAITGRQPSPIADRADTVLLTVSSETRYREEAMASRIAQLSLIDTLYVLVALRRPGTSVEALRRTSEALSTHRA